jgi:hypothetical protein
VDQIADAEVVSAVVDCFLKIETSTKCGDPRNISPRTDRFLAVVGPYISAIEHAAVNAEFLVKGLSISKRNDKMATLNGFDCYIETDYSRMDMTISEELIREFEEYLLTCHFQGPAHHVYREVLKKARSTHGVAQCGIEYFVRGTRCSGDAHTSIANGLINYFMMWIVLGKFPRNKWTCFVEGDDGIIGLTRDILPQVLYNMSVFGVFGFQVKCDVHYDLSLTSFCGRFLVSNNDGISSYCDFNRSFAKIHTSCADGLPRHLAVAKCVSYLVTDGATPIIGEYCAMVVRCCSSSYLKAMRYLFRRNASIDWYWRMHTEEKDIDQDVLASPWLLIERYVHPPTAAIRGSFALRTGISPALQIKYEQMYRDAIVISPDLPKIVMDWNFDNTSHVHGAVCDFVS